MPDAKYAACYIRVSTEEQEEYFLDSQLREIQDYAAKNNMIAMPDHIYIDGAVASNKNKRPLSVIVLAAGQSQRMGKQKLLLPLKGQTILGRTLDNVKKTGVKEIILVLGCDGGEIWGGLDTAGLRIVENKDYALGQMTSVKAGLKALSPGNGAMFVLGDQPYIGSAVYLELIKAYQNSDALIVLPVTEDGKRGNPVIFAPQLFAKIKSLEGDSGPRSLIEAHARDVLPVLVFDDAIHLDIDTPQTYRECLEEEGD